MSDYIPRFITSPPDPVPPPPEPRQEPDPGPQEQAGVNDNSEGRGSQWNALRDGHRSRTLFPDMMIPLIERYTLAISAELNPESEYEEFLVLEMARSSAQLEAAARLELPDLKRFHDRLRNQWPEYRAELIQQHVVRLPRVPEAAARALRKTRQGAEYVLEHLKSLERVVAARGELNEEERQHLFDLMGTAHTLRRDPQRCPAGHETAKLAALISGEIVRLAAALESDLIGRDKADRERALCDLPVPADAETRRLRSNMNRARRRFGWAREVLEFLRNGGSPVGLIDPESKKSLADAVAAHVAEAKAKAKAKVKAEDPTIPDPPSKTQDPAASPAETPTAESTASEEISIEDRQAVFIGAAAIAGLKARRAAGS